LQFGQRLTAANIGRFQRERLQLMEEVAAVFERHDLLLTPTMPTTAFAAEGPMPAVIDGEPLTSAMHALAFTYPFNLTGHPAATVRAGLSRDGLPIGLQLVAARGREELLLPVARAYERVRPFDGWPDGPPAGVGLGGVRGDAPGPARRARRSLRLARGARLVAAQDDLCRARRGIRADRAGTRGARGGEGDARRAPHAELAGVDRDGIRRVAMRRAPRGRGYALPSARARPR